MEKYPATQRDEDVNDIGECERDAQRHHPQIRIQARKLKIVKMIPSHTHFDSSPEKPKPGDGVYPGCSSGGSNF